MVLIIIKIPCNNTVEIMGANGTAVPLPSDNHFIRTQITKH